MGRPYSVGKPVMAQARDRAGGRNHGRLVFGSLAGLTGVVLVAAFVTPFYGALDRPVVVVESGKTETGADQGTGKEANGGIVVEQFDYDEPAANGDAAATQLESAPPAENAPNVAEGELQREAPRPPLSDLGLAASPKPPEPPAPAAPVEADAQMQLLQRPVAVAAGRLESQGRTIELQGIEIVPAEESCQSPSGESWPCGMQARTAFRQWLRSRAVLCRLPQNDSGGAVATECKVGDEDAARWLVENGWARAAAGGSYEEDGRKAQDAHRGIFGEKPDTSLPSPSPEANPLPDMQEPTPAPKTPQPAQPDGEFPPAPPAQ